MGKTRSGNAPSPTRSPSDINATPLMDVMPVLLIMFMAVTPMAERGLDIALRHPSAGQAVDPSLPQVVMTLDLAPGGGSIASMDEHKCLRARTAFGA
jgi:biopolymer transport protein ExbD